MGGSKFLQVKAATKEQKQKAQISPKHRDKTWLKGSLSL